MAEGDENDARTVLLPVSGDVVQWLPDGRWRLVSRAQFQTEQSRSPRLPVEKWFEPAESLDSYSSEQHPVADGGQPAWWRYQGMVSKETRVVARYPDGSEAVVLIAGPVWIVEGLLAHGMADVAVGDESISHTAARRRVREAMYRSGGPRVHSDDEAGGWWGTARQSAPNGSEAAAEAPAGGDPAADERLRQGVAYVVWTDHTHQRARRPDKDLTDGYSCGLQPFGGQSLTVEDGPELPTLDAALAWARARTSTIIVRPQWDPGVEYWATDSPPSTWKRVRYRNAR